MRLVVAAVAGLTLLGCGTPDEGGDMDAGTTDAGNTDAGDTDAGNTDAGSTTNPNLSANGNWTVSGTASSGCGMALNTGLQGYAVSGTTHEFKLSLAAKFNGQAVEFRCEFGANTKFTCADYVTGMSFSGCNATGGMRDVSGHVNGTAVDFVGVVHSSGTGTCPPTVTCGPKELSVTGTVAP